MSIEKSRRVSTPIASNNPSEDPFHNFRSLRTHNRSQNHCTKQPEVSVILEVDTDCESVEEHKPTELNRINSSKFDRMVVRKGSTRDSRRSTKSFSTLSTKSLDLTKLSRNESTSSSRYGRGAAGGSGGHLNNGFQHSNTNLHGSTSTIHSNTTAPVVREQYFCCRKWTKREKILTTIVVTLILLICGLFVVIGIVAQKRAEKNRENFMLAL